ncbi:hypothetical protein Tco_1286039, partial [Tanacetum coccineum]
SMLSSLLVIVLNKDGCYGNGLMKPNSESDDIVKGAIEFAYMLAQALMYITIFYSLASFEWTKWKFIMKVNFFDTCRRMLFPRFACSLLQHGMRHICIMPNVDISTNDTKETVKENILMQITNAKVGVVPYTSIASALRCTVHEEVFKRSLQATLREALKSTMTYRLSCLEKEHSLK